ncbi:glycoside hydrolase family 2 protein [Actinopolymorpha alba]|uniref:glycoside hydrolase family 2 protein n=1 Tax=Actinopolymorpha alba TaxID=533267 RepID=UPI00036CDC2F|nr:sugar-binding domain-containing protein [Actinopolymorpha alba]
MATAIPTTQRHPAQVLPGLLPSDTRPELDLNGSWSFELDPTDVGVKDGWTQKSFAHTIEVPGSWEEQGFGERPPEFIGGWTKRLSYEGAAWYSRTVEIPENWSGGRIWLQLDRVGWQSTVWVDDARIDSQDSLSGPHRFDLTPHLKAGSSHRLTIRVDNAVTDILNFEGHIHSRHTATTWGGIVGSARLVATPETWIEHVALYPDAESRRVRCAVRVAGEDGPVQVTIRIRAGDRLIAKRAVPAEVHDGLATVDHDFSLGEDARLWSDRDPFLHDVEVDLRQPDSPERLDSIRDRFGLRTFAVRGRSLTLNGDRIFLRGYVDCCIFPLTGYPPDDKAVYAAQFAKAKAFGFNHVRLHSWTPPRSFFEAADEAGMLVQSELPSWGNFNDPDYVSRAGDFIEREFERVLLQLQRHPSLVLHCMGNELLQSPPNGSGMRASDFLSELVRRGRERDPSRLYVDQSGFGYLPEEPERETDIFVFHTFRGSAPDSTATWQQRIAGGKTPVIAHEHSQMDMYARFSEAKKFTGIMEPSWLDQARDGLGSKGILHEADRYVEASGALQARCLKELFERLRRTPGLSGVQMLNLTDFPGQGTALNGVLDVFWDEKGHIEAEEFRRFNAETVLLCESARRTYPGGGWLQAELLLSHFGPTTFSGTLSWQLATSDGDEIAGGSESLASVRIGHPWPVAAVDVRLPDEASRKLTLTAELTGADGRVVAANSWDFWVFSDRRWQDAPAPIRARGSLAWLGDYYPAIRSDDYSFMGLSPEGAPHGEVLLTDRLHVRYVDAVLNGATMIWLAENDELADGVQSTFEPLFWSFLWFPEQPNQTMGLVVEDRPLLADFPHDGTSDWQWFHLVDGATAVSLDALPHWVEPIVGGIDNWNRGKRLGYLLEAQVGKGRILMTTLRILEHYHAHPEAAQLFDAMLRYVHSDAFAPSAQLSLAQLWSIPRRPVGWPHR